MSTFFPLGENLSYEKDLYGEDHKINYAAHLTFKIS